MRQLILLMSLVVLLAACQPAADDGGSSDPAADRNNPDNRIIQWDRDPYHEVFEIEVVGGEEGEAFWRQNEVAPCTIYGDGRVVWEQEGGDGIYRQVLFDYLTDDQVSGFIDALTVEGRIFTYGTEYDSQLPESGSPVYEEMTLAVNDTVHVTDAFADWPDSYYEDILELCQTLADTPTILEPEGAWISVQAIDYDPRIPSVFWDDEASGLSLNDISAGQETVWIEGRNVRAMWRVLRETGVDVQFTENDVHYLVALQVPGVTIDAPPAPGG